MLPGHLNLGVLGRLERLGLRGLLGLRVLLLDLAGIRVCQNASRRRSLRMRFDLHRRGSSAGSLR